MFERISSAFIEELLFRIEIVDLINTRILLKKSGKNYYALCPFHKEKTPSFFVNKKKQYYHCFGCGAHGNAINFLMQYNKLNFIDCIKELALTNGMNIDYQNNNLIGEIKTQKLSNFYKIMNNISKYFQNSLNQLNSKKIKEYLLSRGLNERVIHYFSIGYAPNGSNNLLKFFSKNLKNYKYLYSLGMILKDKNGSFYDFFRYRIIFPIKDLEGRVIAFGGRVLNDKKPKYINSPESKIFKKSRVLYGLYEVMKSNSVCSKLLVVEGYMDVIALTQFNINYSVSSLGTSTTEDHIKLLFRITNTIICCYDGDFAGREAAWRTLKLSLPFLKDGFNLKFMFLVNGEDPDSLIRKEGKFKFEKRISMAKSISNFLIDTLLEKNDLSTCEGKANFAFIAVSLIKNISGNFLRLYLLKKIANLTGFPDISYFFYFFKKNKIKKNVYFFKKIRLTTIKILISLLIQNPNFVKLIKDYNKIKDSAILGVNVFLELIYFCRSNPGINTIQILNFYKNHKFYRYFKFLSIWNAIKDKKIAKRVFEDSLEHLLILVLDERLNFLIEKERREGLSYNERKEVRFITFAKIR